MFNDPVHHHFALRPIATKFFDTRQFQRLRELKQLGLTYMVFPGASHNRSARREFGCVIHKVGSEPTGEQCVMHAGLSIALEQRTSLKS